jgi:hypothetical protein
MESRRVQHVRAGRLERLQSRERVVEIGALPEEVLGAGCQHEVVR